MSSQSNITPLRDAERDTRRARGQYVDQMIKADGRSARYVAIHTGINPTSMGDRLKGKAPFLADELERIAVVLKLDPIDFYRHYIAASAEDPRPEGPDGDQSSNVRPLRFEPRTHSIRGREGGEG